MNKKIKVGILGATGMVGQRFVSLLDKHPWFEVVALGASGRSAGFEYGKLMKDRWNLEGEVPNYAKNIVVSDVVSDLDKISQEVDLVFCALNMDKESIKNIEEEYAKNDVAVVSNNSANRWTSDVPMIIPEINEHHLDIIDTQRENRGWDRGFIVVKSNCSIQSYVAVLNALWEFVPREISITSMQAISGAGKTFKSWPEMVDNVIPHIDGEEEKSEKEPLKIFGNISEGKFVNDRKLRIDATCVRVPVTDGHMAVVRVNFENAIDRDTAINCIKNYSSSIYKYNLPSAPDKFITYFDSCDRPQVKLDRELYNSMGVSVGRIEEDDLFDLKFVSLAHNTVRGAAGGAVLLAELCTAKGFIKNK